MRKHLNKATLKRKFLFYICLQLFFLTTIYGQVTFDPQPSFFRNQREMPLVSLVTRQDILVSNYGAIKNDGLDDLAAIQAAITAAKSAASASNPVRVVFENGIYNIMPPTGASQSLFVTTANNIVFEGNGAEIRNHNPNIGFFEVRSCSNIIFKNLNFDYAVLPFTQGIVTAVNASNNSFTLRIDDGFPLLTESHFTNAPQNYGCLKDATGKLKVGANNYYPSRGWNQISGNTFTVFTASTSYTNQVKVNDYYVHLARNNGKTIFNTISGKNITYLDINIYATPAGSFNGNDNRELNIINCKVIPKPGSGRVQSGNADIIHITGSIFGPWVQGCRFEAFTDDAVNLKHTARTILEVVSPTVIRVKFSVKTTDNFVIFNPRTGLAIATPNAITKVANLGNNNFEVTFDGNHNVTVVGEHQTADKAYLTNSACESAVFRNNVFKNGRRYGILLQSSYAQVKDCTFENLSSSGIKMENQIDWSEGYIANNIEITNNSFVNCGFDSTYIEDPNAAAISTVVSKLKAPCTTSSTWCGTEPVQWQGLSNITITNNNFVYNKTGINIQNINGGIITNNTYASNPQDITLLTGNTPRELTLVASSVSTLTTPARIVSQLPLISKVVFRGSINGDANLQFSGNAEFDTGSDNTTFNGDMVFTANAVNVTANTTGNGAFLKAGRKVQVNFTNCSLILNGANSCKGNIDVGGTNAFALNINANQEVFGTVTIANGSLTINVAPTVTNLSFTNSATIVWGTGTVAITGYLSGEIRFGTNNSALTASQLAKITADGIAIGQALALDANGFLVLASSIANTSWTGTTSSDWTVATNWSNGVPNSSSNVTIAFRTNQPTIATNANIKTLAILSGATLEVTANNLTVIGAITNNGTMTLANNAKLIQGGTTNTNTGNITVNRNSSPLLRLDYTLWSSPVSGQSLTAFSPLTSQNPSRFYTFNTTFNTGGVNGAYAAIANLSLATTPFAAGAGYLIRMPNTAHASTPAAYAGVFTGVPNNGDIPVTLVDGGAPGLRYNLVGNPYPSPISIATLVANNTANIETTLYFWRKTNAASGSAYCTYNAAGSPLFNSNGNAQSIDPFGVIQTGQGFFVVAKPGATFLTFRNGQRVANTTGQFFKTKQLAAPSRIWMNATNTAGAFSQMALNYEYGASLGIEDYDSKYINDSPFALTSNINNEDFTIQGRPAFDASDIVALNFKTDTAGDYTIAIDHSEGVFNAGQDIYLLDSKTGTETNLKNGGYNFAAAAGADNNRFSLKYQKTLKTNASALNDNSVKVYNKSGALYVNSTAIVISSIQVHDVHGRLIADKKNVKSKTATISNLRAVNQILIVSVIGDDNSKVIKKVAN
jgi:hypothetical protein